MIAGQEKNWRIVAFKTKLEWNILELQGSIGSNFHLSLVKNI